MSTKEQAIEALKAIEATEVGAFLTGPVSYKLGLCFKQQFDTIRAAFDQQQDPKLRPALERATKALIAERDSRKDCITGSEGSIPPGEEDDGEYLRQLDLDAVIDECQAALGAAPKPAADEDAPPTPEKLEAMGFPAPGGAS